MAKEEEFTYGYGNISKSIFRFFISIPHYLCNTWGRTFIDDFYKRNTLSLEERLTMPLWRKRWTKAFAILLGVAIPTEQSLVCKSHFFGLVSPKLLGKLFLFPSKLRFSPSFWRLYSCRFTYMQPINFLHL